MKKRIRILCLLFIVICLCSCTRSSFYCVSVDDNNLAAGYDTKEAFNDEGIDSYEFSMISDKEVLTSFVVYTHGHIISIDDYKLGNSIKESCNDLNGEYFENIGNACVIQKRVKGHNNYVVLYGNIVNDDLDELDRVEVFYKIED